MDPLLQKRRDFLAQIETLLFVVGMLWARVPHLRLHQQRGRVNTRSMAVRVTLGKLWAWMDKDFPPTSLDRCPIYSPFPAS